VSLFSDGLGNSTSLSLPSYIKILEGIKKMDLFSTTSNINPGHYIPGPKAIWQTGDKSNTVGRVLFFTVSVNF
jgi:hypothetical protein